MISRTCLPPKWSRILKSAANFVFFEIDLYMNSFVPKHAIDQYGTFYIKRNE